MQRMISLCNDKFKNPTIKTRCKQANKIQHQPKANRSLNRSLQDKSENKRQKI